MRPSNRSEDMWWDWKVLTEIGMSDEGEGPARTLNLGAIENYKGNQPQVVRVVNKEGLF